MKHLILIHGALAAESQVAPLGELLRDMCHVHLLTLTGHGGNPVPAEGLSFAAFVNDITELQNRIGAEQADLFGFSMGGYAALLAALKSPARIRQVITLGTKFDWNPETAFRETRMLQPEVMEQKIPQFVERLSMTHHPSDWKTLVRATARLMEELGQAPALDAAAMRNIQQPVSILVGDQDTTAGVEASRRAATLLPNAQFEVLPQTVHPFEKADLHLIAGRIRRFLE